MTLEDAIKIKESLEELSVNVEEFSWGPSYEFAKRRHREAISIITKEIKRISAKGNNA
jgi:hypothetical protein